MITFQATHSLPNASFQSCPWAFVHASLHRQHPSFQPTVSPANAHSFSRTSPLPLECFLHPPSQERPVTLVCATYPVRTTLLQHLWPPAPRAWGGPLFISASLCSAPTSEQKVLQCSWTEGQWPGHQPPPIQEGSLPPHGEASEEKTRGGDHGLILSSRATVVHLLYAVQSRFFFFFLAFKKYISFFPFNKTVSLKTNRMTSEFF